MARKKLVKTEPIPTTLTPYEAATPAKRRGRPPGTPRTAPQPVIIKSQPQMFNAQGKPIVKYLNNADMLKAVLASKEKGRMNEELATMLMMLVKRYGTKGNFVGYTYNDEMQSFALMMLTKTWASFNEKKSPNCFAYYTQCVKNSFIQYLKTEKKNQRLRDALLCDAGFMPSYSYQLDYSRKHHDEESDAYERDVGVTPDHLENMRTDSIAVSKSFDRFDAVHSDDMEPVEGIEVEADNPLHSFDDDTIEEWVGDFDEGIDDLEI
jgi:hypothetical protein